MITYLGVYVFLGLATFIAVIGDATNRNDLIASAILGFIWPVWLVSRIIRKVLG